MKRSRLKLSNKKGRPPDQEAVMSYSNQTMNYSDAVKNGSWEVERKMADRIQESCQRLDLPMKLDRLTKGEGNCFMVCVLQQLKSSDVYSNLSDDLKRLADGMDPMKLRTEVTGFVRKSRHPRVQMMKDSYLPDPTVQGDPRTWEDY